MKKLSGMLFIGLCACTGCLSEQKFPLGMSLPGMNYFASGKSPTNASEAVSKLAPPKAVTVEDISPATARQTADALRQELDGADARER
jgi:hypothetical protein